MANNQSLWGLEQEIYKSKVQRPRTGSSLLENSYSIRDVASCVIKSRDLFPAADNYWCLLACQK